ncbi:MAG: flavodoxin domain-containing protein [Christensenellales bacterium]|jgi:flavodoxin
MKTAVRYHSLSGNTKKIAKIMAQELGVEAESVGHPLAQPVDILFLGGAVYGGKLHGELLNFIENLPPDTAGKVAVFSTSGGNDDVACTLMKQALAARGFTAADEIFHCPGRFFFFINRGRPSQTDMQAAKAFARDIVTA